jgi:hypothetical protein
MTSIIKVDQIQNVAGGTPTAADLGLNVSGSVISSNRIDLDTSQTITSLNFIDVTGGSITVTPKASSSTFIVTASCHGYTQSAGGSWSSLVIRLLRDTTDLGGYLIGDPYYDGIRSPNNNEAMHLPLIKRSDAPNTTSAVTYKVQAFTKNGRSCIMNYFSHGFLEVLEIAG